MAWRVWGRLRRSSMHLWSSPRPTRPLQTVSAAIDEISMVLRLFSTSSTLWVLGCDLLGKLIDLMWLVCLRFQGGVSLEIGGTACCSEAVMFLSCPAD
nr:hypothetical protein Iba_chr05eCG1670 [Ipomoea batatas]